MIEFLKIEKDAFIHSKSAIDNYGRSNQLYCYKKGDDIFRTFIDFEVTADMINSIGNPSIEYKLRLYISDYRVKSDDFSIKAYPVTKEWVEGDGYIYNDEKGVTWNRSNGVQWDVGGGDYDVTEEMDVVINDENLFIEIDLEDYFSYVNTNGTEYGLILVSNEDQEINAYNFAMYSKNSPLGFAPLIVKYSDTYQIVSSDNVDLYEDVYPIVIDPYNYKYELEEGEFLVLLFNIFPVYKRSGLFFSNENKLKYLPDIKYRIVDESRNKFICDFSDFTRISSGDSGLLLTMNTKNLPDGNYYLVAKYEKSSNEIYYSNRVRFKIL